MMNKMNDESGYSSSLGKLSCVVVAVDSSEESMTALNWALDKVKLPVQSDDDNDNQQEGGGRPAPPAPAPAAAAASSSFVLLHVQPPPSFLAGISPPPIPFGGPSDFEVPAFSAAIEAHQKRITNAILIHALKICQDKNVQVKTKVVVGGAKEKICETVKELDADLLVMGSRSSGLIKRMFMGSVSEYCNEHAQCPVMIVKGKNDSAP